MKYLKKFETETGFQSVKSTLEKPYVCYTVDEDIVHYGHNEDNYEVVPDSYIYSQTDNKYYQKLVVYGQPIETNPVDLNDEWVYDSEDEDYIYYKSNSNIGVDDSFSQCKVSWIGQNSVTFKYMSDSEMGYDYLCVGYLDGDKFTEQPSSDSDDVYLSTKGQTKGEYKTFTIECNEGEHHIWFCYQKDVTDFDGSDQGFIGVPKSLKYFQKEILKEKQGKEIPIVYESDDVLVDGNKTYDVKYGKITQPNGIKVKLNIDPIRVEKTISYEYVDLGLPSGTRWATTNIGAETPTEYGAYFAWGSTSGVTDGIECDYSWQTAPFNNGQEYFNSNYFDANKSNWLDENNILKSEYDIAHVNMGSDWCIPTDVQMNELISETNNEWVEDYQGSGINGGLFISKNDPSKSIFIPASGSRDNTSFFGQGYRVNLWSSSLVTGFSGGSWLLDLESFNFALSYGINRYQGYCVRGVL